MRLLRRTVTRGSVAMLVMGASLTLLPPAFGQAPPYYPPAELERLVSRIALYPDALLAQVLAAATFPDQIPDAAGWADAHHYLRDESLARAIEQDRLPWDPSVQALLPFPSVLGMMASDMNWTSELGNAFLAQPQEVMDAVQRMRHRAWEYGYLRSNPQIVVRTGPYIEIVPANPAFVCVPVYDPVIVYARPRPGFFVGGAINFGFGITMGAAFRPWGWGGGNRFAWNQHTVIINNNRWDRTYVNRRTYVHPSPVQRYEAPRPAERHELRERTPAEREAPLRGRPRVEEHERGRGREQEREHRR
ncbi:MAG TPA: DUF3300 domain-containing protein [Bryobacterales bacterium]|nr:DUF3300 domain-containing protein [Bryobacterales bacterium]